MTAKKLLFDEHPLVVIPELAQRIGLNEAIILQQVHYWVTTNQKAGKNEKDGYYWTYNTYKEWQSQFPFWSLMTIRRTIKALEKSGYLIAGCFNKRKMDKTKWYRLDYSKLGMSTPSVQNEHTNSSIRTPQQVNLDKPIPETKAETTPQIPRVSSNPLIAQMQKHLGFPEKTNLDPIPNPAKEAKYIQKMMSRGFTWGTIFLLWREKCWRKGEFVSMYWVNEDIAKGTKHGEHNGNNAKNRTKRLQSSVGPALT